MISPKSHLFKGLFLFIIMVSSVRDIAAQCNPPDQEPSTDCLEAPLVCLTNACYQTLNNPVNCCAGWCGPNTVVHNPEFFQFIPTCPDVIIDIHVDDCDSGNGLQSALLGECPWDNDDVLACDPGTPPGGTMHLEASGLVVGQIYWLIIDGSGGALCDYTITFTQCIFEPGLDGEITDGEASPASVCQGFNDLVLEVSPPVGNAHGYYWVVEWLAPDTITSTLPTNTIEVPADLSPGIYEICARAFSGCDTSDNEVCFEVEVFEIPDEIKPPASFCPEEFPFNWGSANIDGAGEYFQTFDDADGCSYDSSWVVEEYPEVPVGFLDTLHCEESLFYEGQFYDDADTYDLEYPGGGLNGCDSTAELEVTLAAIDAFIELSCENGEFVLEVLIQWVIPSTAQLEYEWYEGSTIISTEEKLYVLEGGAYSVIVEVITPAGSCFFPLEVFTFTEDTYRPDPPNMGFVDTLVCAQAGIEFEVIVDPFEDPYTYTWSGPANVPIFQDGSSVAEFDFSSSGPAEICVYATNECGDGPPTCFMVEIQPTPVASFTYDTDICADSTTIITFTGTSSAIAEVLWDFDNPTTLVGTGLGPYTVSWAIPGDKVVNLTVIEPGCDTAFFSQVITVSSFVTPVVNCSSTIDSVHFDWDDVVGASGYLVSINGGAATPALLSEWSVSPLLPGTVINLILTVVSGGPCDDIVVAATCTAEDCPPPTIVLSGQNSACLNNPTVIDLDALVNGSPGSGTWAGPGISDVDLGFFDPTAAGAGVHSVIFTTIQNGCPFSEPYSVTVFDSLTADFVLDPLICETDVAGLTYIGNASGSALFDFDFGAATVVAGSGSGPYQLSWASPGNQTVRLQVSENGCTSDIISHNTDVIATLNPPVINCSPNTSGILFSWSVDPAASGHVVNTLIGPAGTAIGTDSLNFTGLVPGDTVQLEIITISSGPCPDRRDSLLCIARLCPMPVITITPADDVCLYPGTGTVDLEVTVTNGAGSGFWAGPGITNTTTGLWSPVAAGAGSHLITYNYSDDGCDFVESITANVYDVPGAFISNTDLMITCATGSIVLDGSTSSGGPLNYQWTVIGSGVIDNGATTAFAEVTAQGVYQLLIENAVSGCVDSTSVTVTQDANIPIADAGPDQTITCNDLVFTMGGVSTSGPNITYNWTTPDGRIIGPIDGPTVQVDLVGEYNIVVRDTSNGCQATDRAMVGIDTAVATVTLTPGDTIDCNTPISSVQSSISGNVSDYAYTWSTLDGTIVGAVNGQSIQVSQGGTYTLTILQNNNGCEYADDAFVPESDEIIDAVNVSLTNVVCHGDNNGTITVNGVTGGVSPYDYDWSGTSQSGTNLTNLGPGFYTLTVSDQNGCSFVESFEVTEPELVTISVGPDMTVRVTDSVIISIITNLASGAIDGIDWNSSNTTINCPGCPTIEFIATNSTTITAMIIDTSGCDATDSMRLTVLVPKIYFIPNVFSPNGDGNNDYFTIWGRFNLINIGYLRIYDRWGNQLFENTDFLPNVDTDGWDGKFKGEPMQPGVYVYTAKLDFEDGKSENVSGEITIIR